ncbi:hypothetical protein [Guptibacillus algicola]|uniref:hypothetical protein n=1 Tax=Guptibacillus algicola TaxID=225844 RepID=UPI001CD30A45|nr:hypothetical protein [Alkalihalobacillus algicola]MCA0986535.1 hypothetical protein [Alkalihalobacillus algicola]
MKIRYRHYEGPEDLKLQYEFWESATRKLPFAWKPTDSPRQFVDQEQFHPKSRYFAFDGKKVVGYMSFTGSKEFVSLGYPWVLPGYEGEVQDQLYDRVYGFAVSEEFGAKKFAQRFRSQWKEPLEYFLSKGFEVINTSPLVGTHLEGEPEIKLLSDVFTYSVEEGFQFDLWEDLERKYNSSTSDVEIDMMRQYYGTVNFDFAIEFTVNGERLGYAGVAIRKDTNYAEVIAVSLSEQMQDVFEDVMSVIEVESYRRGAKTLCIATAYTPNSFSRDGYLELTKDVMVMKNA